MILAQYFWVYFAWNPLVYVYGSPCHPNNFLRCERIYIEKINKDIQLLEAKFRNGYTNNSLSVLCSEEYTQYAHHSGNNYDIGTTNEYFCRESSTLEHKGKIILDKNEQNTSFGGVSSYEGCKNSQESQQKDEISTDSHTLYTELKENKWYIISSARQYRLTTLPLSVTLILEIVNEDSKPSNKFVLLIPYHEAIHMGDLEAYNKDTSEKYAIFTLNCINRPCETCQWNTLLDNSWKWKFNDKCICAPLMLSVIFNRNVDPKETIKLVINYKLGRPFSTIKDSIAINDEQFVIFSTNTHLLSGYKVGEQRTYYSINHTSNVEVLSLHLRANINEIKKNTYLSGPYYQVFPLSLGEFLTLRFPYPSSLEYISHASKHVSMGVWYYRVNEEFLIINESSKAKEYNVKLAKILARDFSKGTVETHHSFSFEAVFPQKATSFYFYDKIGNIAMAYLDRNVGDKYKVVYLIPRYPLMGGWQCTFNTEYSHPILDYSLEILLQHSILLYTDSYTVTFDFPLGSCNIVVTPPSGIKCRVETVEKPIFGLKFKKHIAILHIEHMFPKNIKHFSSVRVEYKRSFWWIPKFLFAITIHIIPLYLVYRILRVFKRELERL